MMKLLQKNMSFILLLVGLGLVLLASRLILLNQLPIFTDEAIYLRWAQIALHDSNWRFISLTDGKQPLFIWLVILAMKVIHDPLVAGRAVSVIAGLLTATGLFFLGLETFKSKWIGFVSALLYVIFPYALVYDRMAIYDSLVGTFTVWGLFFTILLARRLRLDIAFMMAFVSGAAVLNKTNGFFTIYLLPFSLVLFDFKQKKWKERVIRYIGLGAVVVILTYLIYSILRLSPFFYIINQKNTLFFYPLQEWLKHPLTYFLSNLSAFNDWYLHYVGLPLTIAVIASLVIDKKYTREKLLFFIWFIVPYMGFALDGKTIYPRYIFPMTLSLLPLVAYTICTLRDRLSRNMWLIVTFLILVYSIFADVSIMKNFATSVVPHSDKAQYLTDWPAGNGVKESTAFFDKEAAKGPIYLATQGTFGLMPYSYELAFSNNPKVTVKGYWPIDPKIPTEIANAAKKMPTYVVFYEPCPACTYTNQAPVTWPVEKIREYARPDGSIGLTVYKVRP